MVAWHLLFSQLWVFSLFFWDVIRYCQVEKYYISQGWAAFILSINLEDLDSRNIKENYKHIQLGQLVGTSLHLCSGKIKRETISNICQCNCYCPEIFVLRPTSNHLDQIRRTRIQIYSVEESFDTRQHVTWYIRSVVFFKRILWPGTHFHKTSTGSITVELPFMVQSGGQIFIP